MSMYQSLNFDLGEEINMLQDMVASFSQAEVAPIAAEVDKEKMEEKKEMEKEGRKEIFKPPKISQTKNQNRPRLFVR